MAIMFVVWPKPTEIIDNHYNTFHYRQRDKKQAFEYGKVDYHKSVLISNSPYRDDSFLNKHWINGWINEERKCHLLDL